MIQEQTLQNPWKILPYHICQPLDNPTSNPDLLLQSSPAPTLLPLSLLAHSTLLSLLSPILYCSLNSNSTGKVHTLLSPTMTTQSSRSLSSTLLSQPCLFSLSYSHLIVMSQSSRSPSCSFSLSHGCLMITS
jgi:hypothetical protein